MLDIEYKGGTCVVIATKKSTLVVDPKLSVHGLKDVTPKDCVELGTEARFISNNKDSRLAIEGPGEYEVGNFSIRGVAAVRHIDAPDSEPMSTMYRIEAADVRVAVLGNVAPNISDAQLEELGVVDVLIVPVGGSGYTLDATSSAAIVRSIDPKVVIPVHYADSAIRYEVPQDTLDVFKSELGATVETVSKYKIKSSMTLPESLTLVEVTRTS